MKPLPVRSGQPGSGVVALLVILAVGLTVALVAINALSASRMSTARRGWDESLGSWDEMMKRYPATGANAAALEVERLSAKLGIDIAPRQQAGRVRPTDEQDRAFAELRKVVGIYSRHQFERAQRGAIDAPPPILTTYVEAHAGDLDALRHQLLTGETPVWESDLSKPSAAPLPNLLGQINLHKLLTSVALARIHSGDGAGALEEIEASWRLAQSLDDSPTLITQLILIAATRMQLGVLRHVPDVPQIWINRLAERDFREPFITAMKYEGWAWVHIDPSKAWSIPGSWWHRLAAPALRPYTKLCLADVSNAWRERLVNLERVEALCDHDLATHDADLKIPIPRWNKIGGQMVPNLASAIGRLARLELDLELTRLGLQAAADRRANGGKWPASLPDGVPSTSCPRERWTFTRTAGDLEIAFPRDISWPGQRGTILLTRTVMH